MTSSELTTSPADVKVSVRPDWRLPVTLGISFLPWFVVVLFTGGIWSAVDFAAYALGVLGAGYGVVCLAIAGSARTQGLFLAPALGILTVSATGAFWLRVGLPLPGSGVFGFVSQFPEWSLFGPIDTAGQSRHSDTAEHWQGSHY